jgi:molybdopterin converting factor small subunit
MQMQVSLKAIGDLRDYFGRTLTEIELPDGALAQSILAEIDTRWGANLPAYLWNRETCQFKGPVLLVIDKKAVRDLSTPLMDHTEILIMKAIAGG